MFISESYEILQTHILRTFLAYFDKRYFLCIGLYSNKHFLHSYENNIDTVTSKGNCADKSVYPTQQVNDNLHMQSHMDSKPGTLK